MLRFTIERLMGMAVTMLLVSMMVFIIMEMPPGDYADRYAFRKFSGTGVNCDGSRHSRRSGVDLGLDKPMVLRYFDWIGGIVLRGDFGQAFAFETSVVKVIGDKAWLTLGILFTTLILTYVDFRCPSASMPRFAAVRRRTTA
jgi:peptide/nickel transport system permease protein